ncbi:MAG: hypothetical protein IPO10_05485 [Flavobacteriales bacterium]|nr:hypothetical protein [Flavobacteriales bacterium]
MTQLDPLATYGMTSKARLTVMGLITDKKYSFRAAAVGVVGVGPGMRAARGCISQAR